MNIEIIAITDENFTLITKGANTSIVDKVEEVEKSTIELVAEPTEVVTEPVPQHRGPRPVPLENHRTTGKGFFDGTSWGTTDNKRGF